MQREGEDENLGTYTIGFVQSSRSQQSSTFHADGIKNLKCSTHLEVFCDKNAATGKSGGFISNLPISTLLSIRKFPDDSREKPISWVVIAYRSSSCKQCSTFSIMKSSLSIPKSDSISPANSIYYALVVASTLRVFMTFFGSRVLDSSAVNLNYTDIDYNIFTDAAQFVLEGDARTSIMIEYGGGDVYHIIDILD